MKKNSILKIARILAKTEDPKVVHQFLEAILTPKEIDAIALRWKLVCMIESGMSQRAIARKLGVSLCKITRGSRELKHGPESFRSLVKKTVNNEREKE